MEVTLTLSFMIIFQVIWRSILFFKRKDFFYIGLKYMEFYDKIHTEVILSWG